MKRIVIEENADGIKIVHDSSMTMDTIYGLLQFALVNTEMKQRLNMLSQLRSIGVVDKTGAVKEGESETKC